MVTKQILGTFDGRGMRDPIQNFQFFGIGRAVQWSLQPVNRSGGVGVALAVLFCLNTMFANPAIVEAQGDRSMREFRALAPDDLFGVLSTFYPDREPQAGVDQPPLDPSQLDSLEEKGRKFLSSLSPEQQEMAWNLAQRYLQKNGVDSAASKALMKRFGVPPELQRDLSNQIQKIEDRSFQNRDEFRDAMRRATQRAIERARGRSGESLARQDPGIGRTRPSGNQANNRSGTPDDRSVANLEPGRRRDLELADSNRPGEGADVLEPAGSGLVPEATPSPQTANTPGTESTNSGGDSPDGNRRSGTGAIGETSSVDAIPEIIRKNLDQPENDNGTRKPGSRETAGTEPSIQGGLPTSSDGRSSNSEPPSTGASQSAASLGNNPDANFDWETQLREIVGENSDALAANGNPAPRKTGKGQAAGVGQTVKPEMDPESRRGMLDAIKKMAAEKTSSINQNLIQGARATLTQTAKNAGKTKERWTQRFDRLVVEAAKQSVDAKTGLNAELGGAEPAESMFDRLIDRVHQSVVSANQKGDDNKPQQAESSNGFRPGSTRSETQTSASSNSLEQAIRSQSPLGNPSGQSKPQGVDLVGAISRMPRVQPRIVFGFVVIVGVVVLLVYLLLTRVTETSKTKKERKFGKRFHKATIQTPRDLVEAVDYYLVRQFGSESRWWNDRHAQDVLCEGAPQYSSRISELINDYVRARYMRAEVSLTQTEQDRYKSTLHELSKLAERRVVPATGTEG